MKSSQFHIFASSWREGGRTTPLSFQPVSSPSSCLAAQWEAFQLPPTALEDCVREPAEPAEAGRTSLLLPSSEGQLSGRMRSPQKVISSASLQPPARIERPSQGSPSKPPSSPLLSAPFITAWRGFCGEPAGAICSQEAGTSHVCLLSKLFTAGMAGFWACALAYFCTS